MFIASRYDVMQSLLEFLNFHSRIKSMCSRDRSTVRCLVAFIWEPVSKALCMWRSSSRRGWELLSGPVSHQEAECEAGHCSGRAECDEKQRRSITLHDETPAETKLVPPQTNVGRYRRFVSCFNQNAQRLCVMIKAVLPQGLSNTWLTWKQRFGYV